MRSSQPKKETPRWIAATEASDKQVNRLKGTLMAKNSTGAALRPVENRTETTQAEKPVAVVHCYNITATCIESRAVVTANTYDTPASAAVLKSSQLHALLVLASEAIEGAPADIRDNMMSLATDMAREVRALCELATVEA